MSTRTDDILNSMNGMKRAEAPQQFYAGIRAKMARQSSAEIVTGFSWKPVFVSAALFVFLFINIAALNFFNKQSKTEGSPINQSTNQPITQSTDQPSTGIQAFADEYHLGTQSLDQ